VEYVLIAEGIAIAVLLVLLRQSRSDLRQLRIAARGVCQGWLRRDIWCESTGAEALMQLYTLIEDWRR